MPLSDPLADEAAIEGALFQASVRELRSPKPPQMGSLVFVGLFVFFILFELRDMKSPSGIAILVAVLLFHELGHAAGMRLFGFRDVRMFFIPFFGAAASGRPRGVAAWKEAMVSLLGPLPGIVLGFAGMFLVGRHPSPLLFTAVQVLLFLNLFNLLPFGALDGGRFFQRVLFSRHRVLEVGFLAIGSALLAWWALRSSSIALLFFAVFGLVALPARWKVLQLAATLRQKLPAIPPDPLRLEELEARALFDGARIALTGRFREQPTALANTMEQLLDATKRAPGIAASLGLLLLYGAAAIIGLFSVIVIASQDGPIEWRTVQLPGCHAEFPQKPMQLDDTWRAIVRGTDRFTITITPESEGEWISKARDSLAASAQLSVVGDETTPAGHLVTLSRPDRVMKALFVAANGRHFQVVASAPEWGGDQERFLKSFTLDR